MVDFESIDIGQLDPEKYSHQVFIDNKRYRETSICLACNERDIQPIYRPFCKICHKTKIKNFPESFLPKVKALDYFYSIFDEEYKSKKPKKPEWIVLNIPLPFETLFTVMDVEATGDMHKDKSHHVIRWDI